MRTSFTDQHRDALIVCFWILEALFVASGVMMLCCYPTFHGAFHPQAIAEEAQIAWMVSFLGLFVFSFLLRRVARRIANVGWFTLCGVILLQLVLPLL